MSCFPCRKKKIKIPCDVDSWSPFYHKTLCKSYLYNFLTRETTEIKKSTTIVISSFGPLGLEHCYDFLKNYCKTDDYYVVCPVYWNFDQMMDSQLAVTGSCLVGEDKADSVMREVAEELGIVTSCMDNLHHICFSNDCYKINKISNDTTDISKSFLNISNQHVYIDTTYYSYILDVSDGNAYSSKLNKFSNEKNDKFRKVQVVVVGKIKNLLNIIHNISERAPATDNYSIRSIRLISLKEFF